MISEYYIQNAFDKIMNIFKRFLLSKLMNKYHRHIGKLSNKKD